jgi:hypothetical protein
MHRNTYLSEHVCLCGHGDNQRSLRRDRFENIHLHPLISNIAMLKRFVIAMGRLMVHPSVANALVICCSSSNWADEQV